MSSDLQIVVNLKGVFMGKLKEKLKPEKLPATFPAYILAYFMCMMTGFCMIMFFRELMYQIGILKRYGLFLYVHFSFIMVQRLLFAVLTKRPRKN